MTWKQVLWLPLLLVIGACSTRPHAVDPVPPSTQPPTERIFIIKHGWHTGFIVHAPGMRERVPALHERFPDSPYLEFGWGDQQFYRADGFSYALALQAILWPTDTVMHVVAVSADPQRQFPHSPLRELCLTPPQLQNLLKFLANSFDQSEKLKPLGPGLYGDSAFFPGAGGYHAFNTCNQWTARGLRSAGLNITPATHVRADSILDTLDQRQSHHCAVTK